MSGCLFFDIDGTLVDSEHGEIMPSSSCLEAIHKAQKNGYRCLISSGRNLGGLKEYRNLGLDGYIFSDGAGILLEGEDPILTPITDELVQALVHQVMDEFHGEIEVFNKRGWHIMVLDSEGNYIKDAVKGRRINV